MIVLANKTAVLIFHIHKSRYFNFTYLCQNFKDKKKEIYFEGKKQVFANINGFTIKTDQSEKSGGDAEFPEPFTLFLAALGTCAGFYVRSFCDQRGIPTDQIKLSQENHYDSARKIMGRVDIQIHVPSDFPEKYEAAVIQTASLCTVKRHLKEDIEMNVSLVRN